MPTNDQEHGYRDPDMFDVRGSLRSLVDATRQHKLLVVFCCTAALAVAVGYAIVFPPIYVAEARVLVEKVVDNSRDAFYVDFDVFRKDDPRTEMELMKSAPLIADVVKKEGLKYDDVYHPMSSELSYLWKKSALGRAYDRIKNGWSAKPVDRDAPSADDIDLARTVSDMQEGVRVMPVADSNIGELTVKGPSRRVGKIANALLDTYLAQRAERYQKEAQRNLDALDKEVEVASRKADEMANNRRDFLLANNLSFDLLKESQQLTKMVDLEDSIAANRAKEASLEGSLKLVEGLLAAEPTTRTSASTVELNTIRESAKMRRLDLESALVSLRAVYREDSPEVQEGLRSIAELDTIIAREPEKVEKIVTSAINSTRQDLVLSRNTLESQLEGVRHGGKVMQETDNRLRARMRLVPELQTQLRDWDRQFAMASDQYHALAAKRAQAAVSRAMAASAMPSMLVVQRAANPDDRWWPRLKILYPSALLVGLILGVIGAQLRELTNGRVRKGDLKRVLADAPIYGTIRIPIDTRPFAVYGDRRTAGSAPDKG